MLAVHLENRRVDVRKTRRPPRPEGFALIRLLPAGICNTDLELSIDTGPVIINEITLIGSRCGRFEPALNLLRSHSIDVLDMISESLPLSQARRAFARAAESGILKVLLNPG